MKNIISSLPTSENCANCWGRFEYDNETFYPEANLQRDVNANRQKHNFIKSWVVRFIDGIMVKRW